MSDIQNSSRGFRLGVFDGGLKSDEWATGEKVALALAGLWALGVILYLMAANAPDTGPDPLRRLMALLVILLPGGFVWLGVTVRRTARATAEHGAALQAALDQFRKAQAENAQRSVGQMRPASFGQPVQAAAPSPAPATRAPVPPKGQVTAPVARPATEDAAPTLFEAPETPDIPVDTLIRALHFPETAEDAAGFSALQSALRHHPSSQVVRAAQDILTLLSQDGIYMDDLIPDRAKPEVWRLFAEGDRGRKVNDLGGIRDRTALALSARRMREEPIFRDTAHHFLRSFDQTLARVEPEATDAEIARLSDTRSARAFMLIGRVTGLFD